MARPTLYNHRKFRALSLVLGSQALALGSLELIWRCGYDSGDSLIGNSEAVENAADWRGKRGRLTTALVDSGFLDDTPDGYAIHDLLDHAPDYVRKRKTREEKRRSSDRSVSSRVTGQCPVASPPKSASVTVTPAPARARAPFPLPPRPAAGEGSQATDPEQPNSEQPEEPMSPEAREFFAAIANIGRPPAEKPQVDETARRELLERQKAVIIGAGR